MYIPSAVSDREASRLRHYAERRYVTEVGSLLGRSTIALAKTALHVVSIDKHDGYPGLPNDTYSSLKRNLGVAGVGKKVICIKGDLTELINYGADFVFIDLDGTFTTTLNAINLAQSPLVGVHDYQRTGCRGVGQAVEHCGYRVVERIDSLIILEKPRGYRNTRQV